MSFLIRVFEKVIMIIILL